MYYSNTKNYIHVLQDHVVFSIFERLKMEESETDLVIFSKFEYPVFGPKADLQQSLLHVFGLPGCLSGLGQKQANQSGWSSPIPTDWE